MDTVLVSELQSILNNTSMKDTNYIIAKYLLEHLFEFDNATINDLANACFTSPATISRFARAVGCDNFAMMKSKLCSVNMLSSKELVYDNSSDLVLSEQNIMSEAVSYANILSQALLEMAQNFDYQQLDVLEKMIHESKKIYFLGTLLPGALTTHTQFMFLNLRKFSQAGWTRSRQEALVETMDASDSLVIIYSTNGNYCRMYRNIITLIKEKNVKMVFVTQDPNIKEIPKFDLVFYLGATCNSKIGRYKLQLFIELLVNRYYCLYKDEIFIK